MARHEVDQQPPHLRQPREFDRGLTPNDLERSILLKQLDEEFSDRKVANCPGARRRSLRLSRQRSPCAIASCRRIQRLQPHASTHHNHLHMLHPCECAHTPHRGDVCKQLSCKHWRGIVGLGQPGRNTYIPGQPGRNTGMRTPTAHNLMEFVSITIVLISISITINIIVTFSSFTAKNSKPLK